MQLGAGRFKRTKMLRAKLQLRFVSSVKLAPNPTELAARKSGKRGEGEGGEREGNRSSSVCICMNIGRILARFRS